MTNELLHRFGGGALARLRSPGVVGRVWILSVTLGLLVCAVPALAAEIVEVRVGKHPTFTRVVFELDRAAGYRIERSDPSMDVAELIVSLEASSTPRSISKKKALIEQVDVEPNGPRSTARVRLSQDGLRLKEMILTNPPRIVLDLLDDAPAPTVASNTAKAEPVPAPTATDDDQAFDDIVAGIEPDATPPAAEPTPAPVEVATAEIEEAAEVVSETPVIPEPEPAPIEVASTDAATDAVEAAADVAEEAADAALFDDDPQTAATDEGAMDEAGAPDEFDVDKALAELNQAPAPAPKQAEAPKKPRPMVAKSTPEEDGGWMTWALAGGAVLLLAGGAFFFLKRRGGASDGDDWDDEEDDDAIGFGNEDASEANPFAASDDEQTILGGADEQTLAAGMMDGDETTVVGVPDEEKESESVVFDSEENDMDDMEVISREQVNESLGAPAMPPVGGAASDDMQAMFAEMTRRMEALEARCDELVDARDRLERQVAAQTEELRVQRAAIARTQRAVRNLGRGDESVEEQEATEPALREPTPE